MHCLSLSASAAVKVSATKYAENVARKVVKIFKISAKKTALLKSCIKEDVSSQREAKLYLVRLCETGFIECHVSIPVKQSKLGAKNFDKVCPKTVRNALKWPMQYVNFQKFSGGACLQAPWGCFLFLNLKTTLEKMSEFGAPFLKNFLITPQT